MRARSHLAVTLALAAQVAGLAGFDGPQEFTATPGSQWLTYNNRLDGVRYSPLKEITPANAAQLGEVCRVQIDGPTSFHAGILVVGDTLYTNTGRETYALDARTCAVRWKFDYRPEEERCGGANRGMAYLDGRVFRGTCDGRLIALDATNGKLLWKNVIAAPRIGEGTGAAPLAWGGMVYMGISGSELGVRGRVMAYDAVTGREMWRFHTVPMGDEIGADSWLKPETARTGGGGVWGVMSLDVTTGELFVPVGNPWPDLDRAYRPGKNLFTDAIVGLDARTGALKWWHQLTPADWQDFDLVAAPVIYRLAGPRDLMAIGGKDGYLTVVDRYTSKQVFRVAITTVEGEHKGPTPEGVKLCPGYAGGVEWNGPALDSLNSQLITPAVDACFLAKSGPSHYAPGVGSFGGTVVPVGTTSGWLTAVDMETGAVRWKYHAEKPMIAGVTPTAGGVTFTGDLAGNFLVFDSKTGKVVHKAKAGGAMAAGVVTYELGGRQYVAYGAGNISRNAFGDLGNPSVVVMMLNPGKPGTTANAAQTRPAPGSPAGTANLAAGRTLYSQVCVACHGLDGNMISDHRLTGLKARRDLPATIAYIKDPKAPMPKMYPDLLSEQSIADVAAYIHSEL